MVQKEFQVLKVVPKHFPLAWLFLRAFLFFKYETQKQIVVLHDILYVIP